jgi:hypothetical protein
MPSESSKDINYFIILELKKETVRKYRQTKTVI